MTTSILSHLPSADNKHDLDVIRDFAIKAPWEWQQMLNALCDKAEGELDADALRERIESLEESMKSAAKDMKEQLAALRKKFDSKTGVSEDDFDDFEKAMTDEIETLELESAHAD